MRMLMRAAAGVGVIVIVIVGVGVASVIVMIVAMIGAIVRRLRRCRLVAAAARSASVGTHGGRTGCCTGGIALSLVTRAKTLRDANPRQERQIHRQALPKVTESLNSL